MAASARDARRKSLGPGPGPVQREDSPEVDKDIITVSVPTTRKRKGIVRKKPLFTRSVHFHRSLSCFKQADK
jgi:hypothetical protein